ncbi:hypothetical protein A0H81_11860 [Grifola frondosa]|uniref:Uncharacterized protein n=1 Tax=Grifola frondosa TaxID=5627 RepID=A0A1C7LU23_GRIFR|nr:hypothetical protein A0H81_11860 [Grifola frondosa]
MHSSTGLPLVADTYKYSCPSTAAQQQLPKDSCVITATCHRIPHLSSAPAHRPRVYRIDICSLPAHGTQSPSSEAALRVPAWLPTHDTRDAAAGGYSSIPSADQLSTQVSPSSMCARPSRQPMQVPSTASRLSSNLLASVSLFYAHIQSAYRLASIIRVDDVLHHQQLKELSCVAPGTRVSAELVIDIAQAQAAYCDTDLKVRRDRTVSLAPRVPQLYISDLPPLRTHGPAFALPLQVSTVGPMK